MLQHLRRQSPRSMVMGHHAHTCVILSVQVAFLAMMVGPRVSAASAQRALEVLAEDDFSSSWEMGTLHEAVTTARLALDEARVTAASPPAAALNSALSAGMDLGGPPGARSAGAAAAAVPDAAAVGVAAAHLATAEVALAAAVKKLPALASMQLRPGQMRAAAAAGLGAAAVQAKLMAEEEEREILRLVEVVVQMQGRKIELKVQCVHDMNQVRLVREVVQVQGRKVEVKEENGGCSSCCD